MPESSRITASRNLWSANFPTVHFFLSRVASEKWTVTIRKVDSHDREPQFWQHATPERNLQSGICLTTRRLPAKVPDFEMEQTGVRDGANRSSRWSKPELKIFAKVPKSRISRFGNFAEFPNFEIAEFCKSSRFWNFGIFGKSGESQNLKTQK